MTKPPDSRTQNKAQDDARKARLAQALRDNLKRRKAQARNRQEDRNDQAGKDRDKADSGDAGGTEAKRPGRGPAS